jgi:hypothetical protein
MFAAAHLDKFLFLLFVAVAIFFQLLTRLTTKTRRRTGGDSKRRSVPPSQTQRPATREPNQSDEDRIRQFLEALGQPTTSKPPPPVARRPTYQKPIVVPRSKQPTIKRSIFSPLPPVTTQPPEFEVHEGPPPLAQIAEVEASSALQPTPAQPISSASETKINLTALLRSPSGLRDAIILREIFGPPRSMQPLDLTGRV